MANRFLFTGQILQQVMVHLSKLNVHRKTEFIENIIEKNFKDLNYDSFYRKKTLGYDNFSYEDYIKIFGNENVCNIYGNKGKVVFADTAGSYRETKVINSK